MPGTPGHGTREARDPGGPGLAAARVAWGARDARVARVAWGARARFPVALPGREHVVAQLDHAVVEALFVPQREVEAVVRQEPQPAANSHRTQQDVDPIDQAVTD